MGIVVASITLLMIAIEPAMAVTAAQSGNLRVVSPGTDSNLTHGGSGTEFGLVLPPGARCPADSRTGGNFVFGYMVPTSVRPENITFDQLVPVQGFDLLYNDSNEPWGPVNTDPITARIPDLPPSFAWSHYGADSFIKSGQQSATWAMGVGCAYKLVITRYWAVTLTVTKAQSDPKGYTWTVDNDAKGPGPGFPWLSVTPLVLAVVLGAASILMYRRSRPRSQPASPPVKTEEKAHV